MGKKPEVVRVQTFSDRGTVSICEDGLVSSSPFFAVLDGYSAPYAGKPPRFRCGQLLTGGQIFTKVAVDNFNVFSPDLDLRESVLFVSRELRLRATSLGWRLKDSAVLPGVSFAIAKVGKDKIEILQGGDCFALWLDKSGKVGITKRQFPYPTEKKLRETIAQLMEKHQMDRLKMWQEFCPILSAQRRKDVNIVYAILNGQHGVEEVWQRVEIPLENLSLLLLFTDGFVPFELTEDPEDLALRIRDQWQRTEQLGSILQWTRLCEKRDVAKSHVNEAEATAVAVKFA